MPGGRLAGGRREAGLIGAEIIVPAGPLPDVGQAELPVFVGPVDPGEEALPLLLLREVEEKLEDLGAAPVEVLLEVDDGAVPVRPQLPVGQRWR
jgi:hypothetical protein